MKKSIKLLYGVLFGILAMPMLSSLAVNAVVPLPSPFSDRFFYYECVEYSFRQENPSEEIAEGGLTDGQLAKIENLICDANSPQSSEVDMSGLEKLTGIQTIAGPYETTIRNLDLSYNQSLTVLELIDDSISEIDLSHNPELEELYLYDGNLSEIDLSHNPKLKTVSLNQNPRLSSLDISKNTKLGSLRIYGTNIDYLDISNNKSLAYLEANNDILLNTNNNCSRIDSSEAYGPNDFSCDVSGLNLVYGGRDQEETIDQGAWFNFSRRFFCLGEWQPGEPPTSCFGDAGSYYVSYNIDSPNIINYTDHSLDDGGPVSEEYPLFSDNHVDVFIYRAGDDGHPVRAKMRFNLASSDEEPTDDEPSKEDEDKDKEKDESSIKVPETGSNTDSSHGSLEIINVVLPLGAIVAILGSYIVLRNKKQVHFIKK